MNTSPKLCPCHLNLFGGHPATLDVDLGLDAEALGDDEYVTLVDALRGMAMSSERSFVVSNSSVTSGPGGG